MDDPDYEVHPLDRDYSEVESASRPMLKMPEGNIHRAGILVFLTGFVTLLVTAVLLGIFRGSGPLETFGSYAHRFAMLMILLGGILILVGLRIRSLKMFNRGKRSRFMSHFSSLVILLVVNVLVLVVFYAAMNVLVVKPTDKSLAVFSAICTAVFALLATAVVYQRGAVRGYAIGVLAACFFSSYIFDGGIYDYRLSSSRGTDLVSYWTYRVLKIQACGMLCACYAVFAERNMEQRDDAAGT